MGTHDPLITYYQAARIHAQVWVEDPTPAGKGGGSREKLEKDPAKEINLRKKDFGIPPDARLIALELYNASLGDIDFDNYTNKDDLVSIYTKGQDKSGKSVTMQPSLWIPPSGPPIAVGPQSSAAISLSDWARIYAYIWYQFRFANPLNLKIKGDFENDPVKALVNHKIIDNINNESNISPIPPPIPPKITATPGTDPLITHGAPPLAFATNFQAISDDPNALGYRYIVRFSC